MQRNPTRMTVLGMTFDSRIGIFGSISLPPRGGIVGTLIDKYIPR